MFVCHLAATWRMDQKCLSKFSRQSIAVHHFVWLVHKPHVGIVVLYYRRFDSMARFVSEIVFNRRRSACLW
jgi:hypothetical protein